MVYNVKIRILSGGKLISMKNTILGQFWRALCAGGQNNMKPLFFRTRIELGYKNGVSFLPNKKKSEGKRFILAYFFLCHGRDGTNKVRITHILMRFF